MSDSLPKYTAAFILPASALVSTAASDINRHRRNKARRAANEKGYERLAFYPADVRGALSPDVVLERALKRAQNFVATKKPHKQKNRALLYVPALISAALAIE